MRFKFGMCPPRKESQRYDLEFVAGPTELQRCNFQIVSKRIISQTHIASRLRNGTHRRCDLASCLRNGTHRRCDFASCLGNGTHRRHDLDFSFQVRTLDFSQQVRAFKHTPFLYKSFRSTRRIGAPEVGVHFSGGSAGGHAPRMSLGETCA